MSDKCCGHNKVILNRRKLLLSAMSGLVLAKPAFAETVGLAGLDPDALKLATLLAEGQRQDRLLTDLENRLKAASWIVEQPSLSKSVIARIGDGPNHGHGPWCSHFYYSSRYDLEQPDLPRGGVTSDHLASARVDIEARMERLEALSREVQIAEDAANVQIAMNSNG